ncbi:MAG: Ig domain-containing protein, partial [Clostridia bacterium]|nr:Ig domain-containing protein [Clostridia bacterium]
MKKVLRVTLSILIIAIYITGIGVLVAQALTPGSESSNISQNFGDRLDEVVTEIKKPEITEVRVSDIGISSVTVSGEKYTDSEIEMHLGETGKIKCRITPEDATDKSLSYTSSDDSIVLAYPDGRIVAKALGSATVTVTSLDNPGLTDTVKVTVTSLPIEGISIAEPSTIFVGEKIRLELEFTPKNTTEKAVSWHSSDPDVLYVDK